MKIAACMRRRGEGLQQNSLDVAIDLIDRKSTSLACSQSHSNQHRVRTVGLAKVSSLVGLFMAGFPRLESRWRVRGRGYIHVLLRDGSSDNRDRIFSRVDIS